VDRELDEMFEHFADGAEQDETHYREQERLVEEHFEEKMQQAGKALRFAQDAIALFRYFRDAAVIWQKKVIVVAALVYFILPLDAIPDLTPVIGYLDDFGVIAAVTKFLSDELAPYYPR
jgi:uncharacterized membrane protein YkvA (DUF1232 family)